jgi:Uma2 family endonuclease
MAATALTKLTVDDYLSLPEDGRQYQLIDGEFLMAPAPFRYHQRIALNLGSLLNLKLRESGEGEMNIAPFDVHFDRHNVFQPDLCFFSKERMQLLSDRGAEGAPDWVIEILSESTARLDRISKRALYARFGVKELWLIDPESDLIERYLLQEDPSQPEGIYRLGEHEAITPRVLSGMTLRLDSFLGDERRSR